MIERLKREKATIMVVEDDPTTEQSLIDCLSDLGNVVTFSNAENALNFVSRGGRVDLVIADIVLGQMNGIELCEVISEHFSGDQFVPVLFYSAFADSSMERLAYQAGGLDFIEKPMSFARLQLRVHSFLQISKRFNSLRSRLTLDPCTGLMQRVGLVERGSIELIKRLFSHARTALLLINIDGMEVINSRVGYRKGDSLLELLAQNLLDIAEGTDRPEMLLGRHMADQFMVLIPACSNDGVESDIGKILSQLQHKLDLIDAEYGQVRIYGACSSIVHNDDLRVDRGGAQEVIHELLRAAELQSKVAKAAHNSLAFTEITNIND